MVEVPGGVYRPLYRESALNPLRDSNQAAGSKSQPVAGFYLDAFAVTNSQFLEFVDEVPRWRRSRVAPLFADAGYLRAWESDASAGPNAPARSPVVGVSWFAARAYCKAKGKRLPTTAQWEYAATASETVADGTVDPAFAERILNWYAKPASSVLPAVGSVYRNAWGVHDMHGLVWEWTRDFGTALVTGESRGDSSLERRQFCGAASIGASDFKDYAAFMRYAFRSSLNADYTVSSLGFRCARDLPR
jgi:sulfatase modifying factor 1